MHLRLRRNRGFSLRRRGVKARRTDNHHGCRFLSPRDRRDHSKVACSFCCSSNLEFGRDTTTTRAYMAVRFTSQEISRMYDGFARWYDWAEAIPEVLGVSKLRRTLLRRASGSVLEVAVGTGKNLNFYPESCSITAADLSRQMLNVARSRAGNLSAHVSLLLTNAEALPFDSKSFDTVVSTLSTCTFPNPVAALREMRRVCRTDGKILLLEHGRSQRESIGRWQDRHEDSFAKRLGCHWNREPLELASQANLRVVVARHTFFGIFHVIEAKP